MPIRQPDTTEVETAWKFFLVNWVLIGAMGAALALSLLVTKFSIEIEGVAVAVGYVGLYAGFAHANARSPARRDPQVMFVLGNIAHIVLITVIMTPLTYVAASLNFPLQDANLLAADRAMGLHWATYVHFVDRHAVLANWLNYAYTMIRWPIFAIPVFLAAKGRYERIEEFTFAFGVALIATTIISAIVPAIGVYQQIGLDPAALQHIDARPYLAQLHDLPPTRAGVLRQLDLVGLAGIVTFPSFHAASALLYVWALWPVRWMRPIAIFVNSAMLAATPIDGGHYFVDIFAGFGVALAAIALSRQVGALLARQRIHALDATPIPVMVPAE
jgi:hypothetical protein